MNSLLKRLLVAVPVALVAFLLAEPAWAQDAKPTLNKGDTAWIIVATALVLFMNIPALAFFYGGLVRTKNVLSVLMQCLALTAAMTVIWLLFGYSLSFDAEGMVKDEVNLNSFIGGFGKAMLSGVTPDTITGTIPEILFFAFQMTFAIITPGLIIGAFAERMKFSAMMIFSILWLILVYCPICHMTWGGPGGYFADMGVMDHAGGIVVHITAGVAALVACIIIGKRKGYPELPMPPHNLTMTFAGTAMLWVGWYGFNAGSGLKADGGAAMALLVTHISASVATLVWIVIEWVKNGKPSLLGAATGAIAGLAAVTPASGFIGPLGALVIGMVSGVVCYVFATAIKFKFRYDDSLDVFGVHGIGGIVGTLLVAVFAAEAYGGNAGEVNIASQLGVQSLAVVISVVYTAIVSAILLIAIDKTIGLRTTEDSESEGLDTSLHGETGYNY